MGPESLPVQDHLKTARAAVQNDPVPNVGYVLAGWHRGTGQLGTTTGAPGDLAISQITAEGSFLLGGRTVFHLQPLPRKWWEDVSQFQ